MSGSVKASIFERHDVADVRKLEGSELNRSATHCRSKRKGNCTHKQCRSQAFEALFSISFETELLTRPNKAIRTLLEESRQS